jgi:hypothetical protein
MRHFKSISEFHHFLGLPAPLHPLISIINVGVVPHKYGNKPTNMTFGFYSIAIKRMLNVKVKYGQHSFDFNEGIMSLCRLVS